MLFLFMIMPRWTQHPPITLSPQVGEPGVKEWNNEVRTLMASRFLFYFLFLLNEPISSLHPVPGTILAALYTLIPLILTVTLWGAHCFYKRRNRGSERLSNVSITEPASWEAFRLQGSSQSTEMVSYLSCPAQRVDLSHEPYALSSLHIVAGFPISSQPSAFPSP